MNLNRYSWVCSRKGNIMGKNLLTTNYVKEAAEKWISNIVIPQVYDDSLSYYEEINKLIGCLNEMGNAFETLPDAVQEILQDTGKLEVVNNVYKAIAPIEETHALTKKEGGELIWFKKDGNLTLYEVIVPLNVGSIYIPGTNIVEIDIYTKIKYLYDFVSDKDEHYNDRAKYNHEINSLFIYKDQLVKANTQINANDLLTDKYTITAVSEYLYNNFKNIDANKAEITKLKDADITLQNHIDDEMNARTEDIENVNSAINTEKNARISADNAINQKLTQETTERKNADYKNSSEISSVNTALSEYWKTIYPVGSIYMSTNSTFNPNTEFGGTWVKTAEGRCLIGANDTYLLGSTGGEATHTLTIEEMPGHKHGAGRYTGFELSNTGIRGADSSSQSMYQVLIANTDSTSSSDRLETNNSGQGVAHNNIQPYLAVNIWERTA